MTTFFNNIVIQQYSLIEQNMKPYLENTPNGAFLDEFLKKSPKMRQYAIIRQGFKKSPNLMILAHKYAIWQPCIQLQHMFLTG